MQGDLDPEAEISVRNALREYCRLDTLAMVELHKVIRHSRRARSRPAPKHEPP